LRKMAMRKMAMRKMAMRKSTTVVRGRAMT
jgi:hypothetical protein